MERKGFLESSKMTINKEGVLKRARWQRTIARSKVLKE
jgi:hypothetical protein